MCDVIYNNEILQYKLSIYSIKLVIDRSKKITSVEYRLLQSMDCTMGNTKFIDQDDLIKSCNTINTKYFKINIYYSVQFVTSENVWICRPRSTVLYTNLANSCYA